MQRQNWAANLGLIIFALFAVGCAFFIVSTAKPEPYVTAGAVVLLAVGQIMAVLAQWSRHRQAGRLSQGQGETIDALSQEIETAAARVGRIEQQLAKPAVHSASDLLNEVRALRDNLQTLTKNAVKPQTAVRPEPVAVPAARVADSERLDLLLEPVIELTTGETVHYRARVNMVDGKDAEVLHADLMAKADSGGMRAALDAHMLKLALPVLRRLRAKHPAMRVLVPLGAATLKTEADLARILRVLEDEAEAARGIVLEFDHGGIAGLDPRGIEGLARLGRLGATMALSKVSVAGLDLAALRQLGVRFLDIEAQAFDQGHGTASTWTEFARFARAMQFQIVAGAVATPAEASAATRIARFGYGPYFAPPRRVRGDAGQEASSSRIQAA